MAAGKRDTLKLKAIVTSAGDQYEQLTPNTASSVRVGLPRTLLNENGVHAEYTEGRWSRPVAIIYRCAGFEEVALFNFSPTGFRAL